MELIGLRDSGLAMAVLAALGAAAPQSKQLVRSARCRGPPDPGRERAGSGPWIAKGRLARWVRLDARAAGTGAGDPVGEIELGLEFELEPGWHVYWKNSGDAGYPPRLDLSGTPALAGAQLLFPAPQRYDLPGGLVSFGYEGQVIYPLSAGLPVTSGESLPPVSARLDYLVCRTECIPPCRRPCARPRVRPPGHGPEAGPEAGSEALATATRLTAAREALPRDPGTVAGAPQVSVRVEPGPASSLVLVFASSGGSLRAARPDLFFEVHPFFALERPSSSRTTGSSSGSPSARSTRPSRCRRRPSPGR